MKDALGHQHKVNYKVISLKIKLNNDYFKEFDEKLDITDLKCFELIIRVVPKVDEKLE